MNELLQSEFENFLRAVYKGPIHGDQLMQIRDAFFAGALICQGRGIDEMQSMASELVQYLIEFKARHKIPEKVS
jgi:hypothetical protein